MSVESLDIANFHSKAGSVAVIDVRSPSEYQHAHIPGSHNIPLFNDDERAEVGILYKQSGRRAAILRGLEFFGPKMKDIVIKAKELSDNNGLVTRESVIVHCWRGGMRSAGVAWLLDLYGFKVNTLSGGYKSFRRWVLDSFTLPLTLRILGGFTGSRKTDILSSMKKNHGAYVIDLERLASHRGSAFGSYGMEKQPSQEMFENLLATELEGLKRRIVAESVDLADYSTKKNPIWVEDESQRIGNINIPQAFWGKMRENPVVFLETPFEERLDNICSVYGGIDKDLLVSAITRIKKRLGGLECKTAIERLLADDTRGCFEVILRYYDRLYEKSLSNRPIGHEDVFRLKIEEMELENVSSLLMKCV